MWVSILFFFLEIVLSMIATLLGISNIVRAKDNRLRLGWGIFAVCISGIILYRSITHCFLLSHSSLYEQAIILNIEYMLPWCFFFQFLALFAIKSLFPVQFTWYHQLVYSFPIILVFMIGITYELFNGSYTGIQQMGAVFCGIPHSDVWVRLIVFIGSLLLPILTLMVPLFSFGGLQEQRAPNFGFFLYLLFFLIITGFYALSVLVPNLFLQQLPLFFTTLFLAAFSFLFFRSENPITGIIPLSREPLAENSPVLDQAPSEDPLSKLLYEENLLASPDLCYTRLSKIAGVSPAVLKQGIQQKGFTGFSEYIAYHRVQYFKQLAQKHPEASVKTLMFESGFTSRTTFYRYFEDFESCSPKSYILSCRQRVAGDKNVPFSL